MINFDTHLEGVKGRRQKVKNLLLCWKGIWMTFKRTSDSKHWYNYTNLSIILEHETQVKILKSCYYCQVPEYGRDVNSSNHPHDVMHWILNICWLSTWKQLCKMRFLTIILSKKLQYLGFKIFFTFREKTKRRYNAIK
jgi:hypothetical protein